MVLLESGAVVINTFLPYADFALSAKCLDPQRLRKQRIEAEQILATLMGFSKGWENHPIMKMWCGYERSLLEYLFAICDECEHRGYKGEDAKQRLMTQYSHILGDPIINPPWLGQEAFHITHKSNLLRKDGSWYKQMGWEVADDYPYYWPIDQTKKQ